MQECGGDVFMKHSQNLHANSSAEKKMRVQGNANREQEGECA